MAAYDRQLSVVVRRQKRHEAGRLVFAWECGRLVQMAMGRHRAGPNWLGDAIARVAADLAKRTGTRRDRNWFAQAEKLARLVSRQELSMLLSKTAPLSYVVRMIGRPDRVRWLRDIRDGAIKYPFARGREKRVRIDAEDGDRPNVMTMLIEPPWDDDSFERLAEGLANKFAYMRRALGPDVMERAWAEHKRLCSAGGQ